MLKKMVPPTLITALLIFCSCGGNGNRSGLPSPAGTLSVTPSALTSAVNDTWTLEAKVQGLADANVTWSVREGRIGGTVTTAGAYTAPKTTGTYHVIATSIANPALSVTVPVNVVAHGFYIVGQITPRSGNTATLLPNGNVLLVGGVDWPPSESECQPDFYLSSSTLFDTKTFTFSDGPTLNTARRDHSAALLPDGKLLIAGGSSDCEGTLLNTTEILAQSADLFQFTGDMGIPRAYHTATALRTGEVLVVGGGYLGTATDEAELYDPSTGLFSSTDSSGVYNRNSHTATVLVGGQILIVGGWAVTGVPALIYDPDDELFAIEPQYPTIVAHTATLLADGTVLIAGGRNMAGIWESRGYGDLRWLNTLYRFDLSTGALNSAGTMLTARGRHTATFLGSGAVLIVGGCGGPKFPNCSQLASAELFDPISGAQFAVAPLHYARSGHHATLLLDGRVLITDGGVGTAEIFQ